MKKEMKLVEEYQKDLTLIGQANALLSWDEETYMPEKGVESRSEQISLLSGIAHDKVVSNELFNALKKLKNSNLNGRDKLIVDKLYKDVVKARKVPKEFVKEFSKAVALAGPKWRESRKKKEFKIFAPYLEKIVHLSKKGIEFNRLPGHPYNTLLDDYEEGMTVEKLIPIFSELKKELVELLRKIESSQTYKKQKLVLMKKEFDRQILEKFVYDVAQRMGLKKEFSRMDLTEHPFTTRVGLGDVRVTTNYRESPMFAFLSTVHEAGHALYELDLPEKDVYNVLGDAPSLGIHESQSRFWENMVARGKPFWKYYYPRFKKDFKLSGDFDEWYKEVNFVHPDKIRVEADEVHYCLHIILRFEIEVGLIDGSIKVKDLPKVWNAKMKELFNVDIKNDVEGVLQDVHWSMGSFGYFPTYAIGTIYSAQLYNQLLKEHPHIEKDVEKGEFGKIREWLKEKVHKHGSHYLADEIIKKVCGEGLNPKVYVNYLNGKYKGIYGF